MDGRTFGQRENSILTHKHSLRGGGGINTDEFDINIFYIELVLSEIFLNKVSVKFLFCSVYFKCLVTI